MAQLILSNDLAGRRRSVLKIRQTAGESRGGVLGRFGLGFIEGGFVGVSLRSMARKIAAKGSVNL